MGFGVLGLGFGSYENSGSGREGGSRASKASFCTSLRETSDSVLLRGFLCEVLLTILRGPRSGSKLNCSARGRRGGGAREANEERVLFGLWPWRRNLFQVCLGPCMCFIISRLLSPSPNLARGGTPTACIGPRSPFRVGAIRGRSLSAWAPCCRAPWPPIRASVRPRLKNPRSPL